jgi:hypothetical protein
VQSKSAEELRNVVFEDGPWSVAKVGDFVLEVLHTCEGCGVGLRFRGLDVRFSWGADSGTLSLRMVRGP